MATMNIRSTFALDKATVQRLKRLATRWRVSKSEALRRAVAQASDTVMGDELTPLEALEWLQRNPMSAMQVDTWLAENEAMRAASDRHREQRLNEVWEQLASR